MTITIHQTAYTSTTTRAARLIFALSAFVMTCFERYRDRRRLIACQRIDRRFAQDIAITPAEIEQEAGRASWQELRRLN